MAEGIPGLIFLVLTSILASLVLAPVALQIFGLPWAPIASFICARIARRRGLDVRAYAIAGAVYSILLFWPWVYLVTRMTDRTIPPAFVRMFYFFVFGIWVTGSTTLLLALAILRHPGTADMYDFTNTGVLISYLGYVGVVVNLVGAFFSQRSLRYRHAKSLDTKSAKPSGSDLSNPGYADVMPVAYAMISFAFTGLLLLESSME